MFRRGSLSLTGRGTFEGGNVPVGSEVHADQSIVRCSPASARVVSVQWRIVFQRKCTRFHAYWSAPCSVSKERCPLGDSHSRADVHSPPQGVTRRCGPLPNYPGHLLLGRIVALVPDADYCYRCSVVCTCVCVCLLDIKPRAVLKRLNRSRFRSGCELG